MLVARNLKHVETQKRNSRFRTAIGVLFFVVGTGLLLFNSAQFLLLAYVLVIVGFIFFNTGLQGVAKWSRRVRNDQLIDQELRRLSDRYTLIHYPVLGTRTPEHVLIHETGVVVMTTKEVIGRVEVRGKTYQKMGQSILSRWLNFSGPQMGQPGVENGQDREALLKVVAAEAAAHDWPIDWPVDGLVVFTAPRVLLKVSENADPPAVKMADVLGWVQVHTRGMPIVLSSEVRQEISEFLVRQGGAVMEGHIDPHGAVVADETPARRPTRTAARTPARSRPTTPQQVVKDRSDRERQARARTVAPASSAASEGQTIAPPTWRLGRRVEAKAEVAEVPVRPLTPLVPSSGMAKVKRRDRGTR